MLEQFEAGGVMMWPMLFIGIGILVLGGRSAVRIRQDGAAADGRLESILFWGAMALVLGLLGTVVGLVQVAQAITTYGSVDVTTLAGGLGITLITLIFGLALFSIALILWYGLRSWTVRLVG